jgi:hypothetical protein
MADGSGRLTLFFSEAVLDPANITKKAPAPILEREHMPWR